MSDSEAQRMADKVRQRADELTPPEKKVELTSEFIKDCLDGNERGDGCLYASMWQGKYLYNTTPKDGEWYRWGGNVWELDEFRTSIAAVEACALEYQRQAEALGEEIKEKEITKNDEESWKIKLHAKYLARIDRLRSANGVDKVLHWAPIVEPAMACRESDFDKDPWLLPVKNGVIDLRTGALVKGRPEDRLTKALDIAYDQFADYSQFKDFIDDISGDPEISSFIKRSFGCAITGIVEQYIWVFTGPGRNGKGVLFDLIGDVMRPYYHVISRGMIIEQRTEPAPSAASEHIYSLIGKRIAVGAETNKGQKIDAGAVKTLTGDDDMKCRPLFKGEVQFKPTHTLFLHTNHVPVGLTKEFSLVQRLLKVEFPFMYVDDVKLESEKNPALAHRFRQKNPRLKEELRQNKAGILRWLVEGALEWQSKGLSPPGSIIAAITELANKEDYIGQFIASCLDNYGDRLNRISGNDIYEAFHWWWAENMDESDRRLPSKNTLYQSMRERGLNVERVGGKTWLYGHAIKEAVADDVKEFKRR